MRSSEWATRQKAHAVLMATWPELAGADLRTAHATVRQDLKPLPELDDRRDPPRPYTAERTAKAIREAGYLVAQSGPKCPMVGAPEAGPLVPWEPTPASIQTRTGGTAVLARAANSWNRRRKRNR